MESCLGAAQSALWCVLQIPLACSKVLILIGQRGFISFADDVFFITKAFRPCRLSISPGKQCISTCHGNFSSLITNNVLLGIFIKVIRSPDAALTSKQT
jgi:hypothetical protein